MRRLALCASFGILVLADLFGAVLLAATLQITFDHGGAQGYWFVVAGFALLCGTAVALTLQVAKRIWPRFPTRFARPS